MNRFNFKVLMSEFFSLVLLTKMIENLILSKIISGTPNRHILAFFMPITGQILPYTGFLRLFFMVWLILQNKPFGEYVERLLIIPRVRPNHPILGNFPLTQKLLGGYHA